MEEVMKRLYEIESAATSIMEHADLQKKKLEQEMAEKTAAFDTQLAEKTAAQISKIKEKLNAQINRELEQQRISTEKLLAELDSIYNNTHSQLAQQIVASLIKE